MSMHDHTQHRNSGVGSVLTSRTGQVLIGFLAIGGILLFTEHQAHALGALFWLLPLVCIVMHLFMHGGHGGHADHGGQAREVPRERRD